MKYLRAIRASQSAAMECRAARASLRIAVNDSIGAYQARPLPVLAGAAGVGFVLARFGAARGLARHAMRTATGPGWRLLRQFLN